MSKVSIFFRGVGFTVNVEFSIVWLSLLFVSGGRPWVVTETRRYLVSGRHLFSVGGPEPSQDVFGFQVRTVFAAFEVAETTRCPDVRYVI